MATKTLEQIFGFCAVQAESVEDFYNRYYRHDRYKGRGEDYAAAVLASGKADMRTFGVTIVDSKSSVTGCTVAFLGGSN